MFAMAAMRANLEQVMTEPAYQHMFTLATQLADGLRAAIALHKLPWCVTQVGARTEFQFAPSSPHNGAAAQAILDSELEQVIHLYLLNRGLLITPFHNMLLVCPETTVDDVRLLLIAFAACLAELV